jgi:3-oxoacyl-(acyl-carrier-protein) synthase
MRRVVVTGLGIVSSIGNNRCRWRGAVGRALRHRFKEEYRERGFRSQVDGSINIDLDALVDRKLRASWAMRGLRLYLHAAGHRRLGLAPRSPMSAPA